MDGDVVRMSKLLSMSMWRLILMYLVSSITVVRSLRLSHFVSVNPFSTGQGTNGCRAQLRFSSFSFFREEGEEPGGWRVGN